MLIVGIAVVVRRAGRGVSQLRDGKPYRRGSRRRLEGAKLCRKPLVFEHLSPPRYVC